jgi:cytidylate kinase
MLHEQIPHHVGQTLGHLCQHWAEEHKRTVSQSDRPLPKRFTVALSREAGTQGTAVGQEVGRRLGWTVYDNDLLTRIAQDMGVHTYLLKSIDERQVSWLKETFDSFFGVPSVGENAYVHRLVKAVLALGSHGECVIVGRGAIFLLPVETTLRVRLVAPLKDRIDQIGRQQGITEEKAKRQIEETDRLRNAFVQSHFFKDPADPRHYDVLLNVARYGVAGCAELIIDALECLQVQVGHPVEAS